MTITDATAVLERQNAAEETLRGYGPTTADTCRHCGLTGRDVSGRPCLYCHGTLRFACDCPPVTAPNNPELSRKLES